MLIRSILFHDKSRLKGCLRMATPGRSAIKVDSEGCLRIVKKLPLFFLGSATR